MRTYLFVLIGGALGAISRFALGDLSHLCLPDGGIPITLSINVSGSFLLALFLTIALDSTRIGADARLGISTGFLGGFTTFSTLCKESVSFWTGGEPVAAIAYVVASVLLGLGAIYLGTITARAMRMRRSNAVRNEER